MLKTSFTEVQAEIVDRKRRPLKGLRWDAMVSSTERNTISREELAYIMAARLDAVCPDSNTPEPDISV